MGLDNLESACERARERLSNKPEYIARLERLGWERSLIYKTLVLTGLRRGALASLTIAQLHLDATQPYVELEVPTKRIAKAR